MPGVAAVPAFAETHLVAQVERHVVGRFDQQHGRAVDQQLRDLGFGRGRRDENDRLDPLRSHRRADPGQRRRRVAGAGGADDANPGFDGAGDDQRAGAILERSGRVQAVVLDPRRAECRDRRRGAARDRAAYQPTRSGGTIASATAAADRGSATSTARCAAHRGRAALAARRSRRARRACRPAHRPGRCTALRRAQTRARRRYSVISIRLPSNIVSVFRHKGGVRRVSSAAAGR